MNKNALIKKQRLKKILKKSIQTTNQKRLETKILTNYYENV